MLEHLYKCIISTLSLSCLAAVRLLQQILLQHITQMQSLVLSFYHDLPQHEPNLAGSLRGRAYGTAHVSAIWQEREREREKVLNVSESVRGSNKMSGVRFSAEGVGGGGVMDCWRGR